MNSKTLAHFFPSIWAIDENKLLWWIQWKRKQRGREMQICNLIYILLVSPPWRCKHLCKYTQLCRNRTVQHCLLFSILPYLRISSHHYIQAYLIPNPPHTTKLGNIINHLLLLHSIYDKMVLTCFQTLWPACKTPRPGHHVVVFNRPSPNSPLGWCSFSLL